MINLFKSLIYTNKCINLVVEKNIYIFDVDKKLKKPQIKKTCQEIFDTKVLWVNSYILPSKKRRPNFKRVFVKFAKEENIFDNMSEKESREESLS